MTTSIFPFFVLRALNSTRPNNIFFSSFFSFLLLLNKDLEFDTDILVDDFVGAHYEAWASKATSSAMWLTDPEKEEEVR